MRQSNMSWIRRAAIQMPTWQGKIRLQSFNQEICETNRCLKQRAFLFQTWAKLLLFQMFIPKSIHTRSIIQTKQFIYTYNMYMFIYIHIYVYAYTYVCVIIIHSKRGHRFERDQASMHGTFRWWKDNEEYNYKLKNKINTKENHTHSWDMKCT